MKKLTTKGLVIVAALLVVAIIGGTAAYGYFTSGKTIANNQISTGSIILSVNDDGATLPIVLPQLMPGDAGTAGNYKIENIGTTPGTLWVGVGPNGLEFDDNLSKALLAVFWLDTPGAGQGTWSENDKYFVPDGHYQQFTAGDGPAVPVVAYKSLYTWQNNWSNTLDVPGAAEAGILKMTYVLPAAVDDPYLMAKSCNFDLLVELHQYHYTEHVITLDHVGSHAGAEWTAVANGVIVNRGNVGPDGYTMTLPADVYDIVFTKDSWTWTKHIDITVSNQAFDLPA